MRRLGVLLLVLASCASDGEPATTTSPLQGPAEEFAASADRALDGTRFAELSPVSLAAMLVDLCTGTGPLSEGVAGAVAGLAAPAGDPGDDTILTEVLIAGVAEVCPERVASDLSAAFLASIRLAVERGSGTPVDDSAAITAGLSACSALDGGEPGDALVSIAASLFGVEATIDELLGGAIGANEGVTAGAVLASAVAYLCPEHAERVGEFLAQLAS